MEAIRLRKVARNVTLTGRWEEVGRTLDVVISPDPSKWWGRAVCAESLDHASSQETAFLILFTLQPAERTPNLQHLDACLAVSVN